MGKRQAKTASRCSKPDASGGKKKGKGGAKVR
jgi:hypothetical protein